VQFCAYVLFIPIHNSCADSAAGPSSSNLSEILLHSTSKPFHEKSEREKEELLEKIAEQLAAIADHYGCLDLHPHGGGGGGLKKVVTVRSCVVSNSQLPTVVENMTSGKGRIEFICFWVVLMIIVC